MLRSELKQLFVSGTSVTEEKYAILLDNLVLPEDGPLYGEPGITGQVGLTFLGVTSAGFTGAVGVTTISGATALEFNIGSETVRLTESKTPNNYSVPFFAGPSVTGIPNSGSTGFLGEIRIGATGGTNYGFIYNGTNWFQFPMEIL